MRPFLSGLVALLRLPSAVLRIAPVRLRRGDTIVLTLDTDRPTREHLANLQRIGEQVWPGHKVVVLPPGIRLSVVRGAQVAPDLPTAPPVSTGA